MSTSDQEMLEWVNGLASSIESDIKPALCEGQSQGGYYSSIQLIFSSIDTWGALFCNKSNSNSAKLFIKEYFGKINNRYEEIPGLLYSIFRHGTIHTSQPKRFIIENKPGTSIRYGFLIGKDVDLIPNSDNMQFIWSIKDYGDNRIYTHLQPKKVDSTHPWATNIPGLLIFPISLPRLYDDLRNAVFQYIHDLKSDPVLQQRAIEMVNKIKTPTIFKIENNEVTENHPNIRNGRIIRKEIEIIELSNL
jgi:hypothetical protein